MAKLTPDLKLYEAVVQVAKTFQPEFNRPLDRYGFRISSFLIPQPFDLSNSKPEQLSKYHYIEQDPNSCEKYWAYNARSFTGETIFQDDHSFLRASIGELCDVRIGDLGPTFSNISQN